jgi:mono/diheme cytochrome c family protein
MNQKVKAIIFTLGLVIILATAGGFIFIKSGVYNIAALSPHLPIEIKMITQLKVNAIKKRSQNIQVPRLTGAQQIKKGFHIYQQQCFLCHGGPGKASSATVRGLNPTPPPLEKAKDHWRPRDIVWIIQNGLKMTGMPGFKLNLTNDEITAVTAFVLRMNTLSPIEYLKMLKVQKMTVTENKEAIELERQIKWKAPDQGWDTMKQNGKAAMGKKLIKSYGCTGCHKVESIHAIDGKVGPSLNNWKKQHYIAGKLVNNPKNLVHWLRYPQEIESHTSMPKLELTQEDAWHIASFLLSDENQ